MPRPAYTNEEAAVLRNRLLDAAFTLYLDAGIEAVTLRQIASLCGLSHTLVYRYFNSKDSLVAAIRLQCLADFGEAIRAAVRPTQSPVERIKAVLSGALSFGCKEPSKYRIVFVLPQPDLLHYPELAARRRELFDSCVDLVQRAIDQGALVGDARMISHGLWSTLHGMLNLHTAGQLIHGFSLNEVAEPIIDLLLAGAASPVVPPRSKATRSQAI